MIPNFMGLGEKMQKVPDSLPEAELKILLIDLLSIHYKGCLLYITFTTGSSK